MKIYSVYRRGVPARTARYWRVTTPRLCCAAMAVHPHAGAGHGLRTFDPRAGGMCAVRRACRNNAYGGMPVQLGLCWGYNTRLNCLEYHRDSEVNVGARDFILLLAKAGRDRKRGAGHRQGKGLPRAGGCGRWRCTPPRCTMRPAAYKCGGRLLHGRCAAARHQYRKAVRCTARRGGCFAVGAQQMAAGTR